MELLTYRVNQKRGTLQEKLQFFRSLYLECLKKDSFWHFFLDEKGGTLRFQEKFEKRVLKWVKKEKEIICKKKSKYDPEKHEYYGVSWLKDEILPLFHDLSVLAVSYPPRISHWIVLERLNHMYMNQLGIHDFYREALFYLELADNRAKIWNLGLPYPTWLYKLYLKRLAWRKKNATRKKKN